MAYYIGIKLAFKKVKRYQRFLQSKTKTVIFYSPFWIALQPFRMIGQVNTCVYYSTLQKLAISRWCGLPSGPEWWSAARRRWRQCDCGAACAAGEARGSEPAGEAPPRTGHTRVETAEPIAKDVALCSAQQNTPPILHPCGAERRVTTEWFKNNSKQQNLVCSCNIRGLAKATQLLRLGLFNKVAFCSNYGWFICDKLQRWACLHTPYFNTDWLFLF